MDTVRLARDVGDVSGLLPTGITSLRDVPAQLAQAIKSALVFLSWEENLDRDEMPPRWMWTDGERLNAHFDELRRRQRDRHEGRGDGPVQHNDAAAALIVG